MKKDKLVVSIQPSSDSDSSPSELASQFARKKNGVHQWRVKPNEDDDTITLYLWKGNGVGHISLNRSFEKWTDRTDAVAGSEIHEYRDSIREDND